MTSTFISRFTPSMEAPETLEALFVQREQLAEVVMNDIRHSATTSAKHYHLLIGPRGLGKTHFVALIANRVRGDIELREQLRLAWLREEERGVTSLLELFMRILHALAREYNDEALLEGIQTLYDQSRKAAERSAKALLLDYLNSRTLLLVIENLGDIFAGLKETGQCDLRAFLQESGRVTIVATATTLFNGVSLQTSPFYGFFTTNHLRELTLDEAVSLLEHIATVRKDEKLAAFLRTPMGRARVRAVHHIAGGNHRVYVVFSEFLTCESLDELVDPVMRMLDDLTPYYQGCINLLSQQQQQLIEFLAHASGAVTVKEIARRCFMSSQTAANHLRDLKRIGYLRSITPTKDRRESFYELREPLMRLCFEVKEYRGGPIRLFVDFLRRWYSKDELVMRLDLVAPDAIFEQACIKEALRQMDTDNEDPRIATCMSDMERYIDDGEIDSILQVSDELISLRGSEIDYMCKSTFLLKIRRIDESIIVLNEGITHNEQSNILRVILCSVLFAIGRNNEAYNQFVKIDDVNKIPSELLNTYYTCMSALLMNKEMYDEALELIRDGLKINKRNSAMLLIKGHILFHKNKYMQALEALRKSISISPITNAIDEFFRIVAHEEVDIKDIPDIEDIAKKAATTDTIDPNTLFWMSVCNQKEEALNRFKKLIASQDCSSHAWMYYGLSLYMTSNLTAAFEAFINAINDDNNERYDFAGLVITRSIEVLYKYDRIMRKRWVDDWKSFVGDHEECRQALVMLSAAVDYLDTKDERVLLSLQVEAREIVTQMLKIKLNEE